MKFRKPITISQNNIKNFLKKLFSLIFAVCTVFIFLCNGAKADELNTLKSIRTGASAQKLRIVLDFKNKPNFEYYVHYSQDKVVIDVFDCNIADGIKTEEYYEDTLLIGWKIIRENFRRVKVEILLKYELPEENINTIILTEPDRIAVTLDKIYHKECSYQVTPNTNWIKIERGTSHGYALINELKINLKADGVNLGIALANNNNSSREKTTDIRNRINALAAVNGGFFATSGGALGILCVDGSVISRQVATRPPRTTIAITKDKQVIIERMIAQGNELCTLNGEKLKNIKLALGGGPRLIKDGRVNVNAEQEGLGKSGNDITRVAGRTAVAIDRSGQIRIYTVTGYVESHNAGMKLEELAELLMDRDIVQAFGLDGGNSSIMTLKGIPVSRARKTTHPERKVANCLLVYDSGPDYLPYQIELQTSKTELPADGKSFADIIAKVSDIMGNPVKDGTIVKFRTSLGKISDYVLTKNGSAANRLFSIRGTGSAIITAECGLTIKEGGPINFLNGLPGNIYVQAAPTTQRTEDVSSQVSVEGETPSQTKQSETQAFSIQILILDEYGNPMSGEILNLQVFDKDILRFSRELQTDRKGLARIQYLDVHNETKISLSCRNIAPRTYELPSQSVSK